MGTKTILCHNNVSNGPENVAYLANNNRVTMEMTFNLNNRKTEKTLLIRTLRIICCMRDLIFKQFRSEAVLTHSSINFVYNCLIFRSEYDYIFYHIIDMVGELTNTHMRAHTERNKTYIKTKFIYYWHTQPNVIPL